MGDRPSFEVQPLERLAVADVLEALGAAYDETFSEEWFAWKHREGPWGPSRGWVAIDDHGIGGLMFSLPWRYRVAGTTFPAARLVDGGTVPRALRRGVFRLVVGRELSEWGPDTSPGILVATATPEAQQSHVKLGATGLAPIDFAYGFAPVPRRARLTTGTEVLDTFVGGEQSHLVTPWDGNSLRWRTDPRSGYSYDAASLASADAPNGVAYRVLSVRALRLLFPVATWGSALDQRVLLGAVARTHAAIGVLGLTGEGAARAPWRPLLRRGQSLLCVWDRADDRGLSSSSLLRSSWALSAADLEGVI